MYNLDHRIGILRLTDTKNDYNETTQDYETYIIVWAQRRDVSAGESYKAAQVNSEISVRFTVRYSSETATITPKDRIVLENGFTYNITGKREIERNKWLEIDAVSVSDG